MANIKNINQLDFGKVYSYADYLKWRLKERIELIKGHIFAMSPAPSSNHQKISFGLGLKLGVFFEKKECEVYAAPFDVRLPKKISNSDENTHTVVQPDLCVICDLDKIDKRGCKGAPDLVVEILSPGNTKKEMRTKFDLYQESGVREYWIVYPKEKWVFIYVLDKKNHYQLSQHFIEAEKLKSRIFPKLKISLDDIFTE